jgi:protein ImuA
LIHTESPHDGFTSMKILLYICTVKMLTYANVIHGTGGLMPASQLRGPSDVRGAIPPLPSALAHVWRADRMGSIPSATVATGHRLLDRELPNGGWPRAALIELMLQQPGIGEMRLLQPAFSSIAQHRPIALVQPPHRPQALAWTAWQLPASQLLWIRTRSSADTLWAAEQILRNGSCGALLLWQSQVRSESLRRLHLAAQASDMLLWLVRPMAAAQDASPAPLRLGVRPVAGGLQIDIIKRRGPRRDEPLFLSLGHAPANRPIQKEVEHAPVDQRTSAAAAARNISPALV